MAVYFLLYPYVAFNAGAPIEESKDTIEAKTEKMISRLGVSADSLFMISNRTQHLNYYEKLKDSLQSDMPVIRDLNRAGINLTGWNIVIGSALSGQDVFTFTSEEIFNKTGHLKLLFDNYGKLRRLQPNRENSNPTFVAGDSLTAIARDVIENIFNYNLADYRLSFVDIKDSLISVNEPGFQQQKLNFIENRSGNDTIFKFKWSKSNSDTPGPDILFLELRQMVKELTGRQGTAIKFGAAVEGFRAVDKNESDQLGSIFEINSSYFILTFSSLFILIVLVFFQGLKHINKGQVEWRRAVFVMLTIGLGVTGWRTVYFINNLDPFLDGTATLLFAFNNLVYGGACGLYAAFAYIGWEALARSQNQEQVKLVDAYWRKQFFFRETGETIIKGYSVGSLLLGLFALIIFLLDTVYYQADSQFGFAEATMKPKLLTMNIAAWINVSMVALGHVGVTAGILQNTFKKSWQFYTAGILLTGILFSGTAILIGIKGPVWNNILVFTLLAPVILYAFRKSGMLTFSTGWWLFIVILMVMPYWGSSSLDVVYVAWLQGLVILAPLVYGVVCYKYGHSVSVIGGYIPAYQERMANHLRVEKEIEIARESQFKLMPLQAPSVEGIDVYGFFMPSFEVGGDYFDYVVNRNGSMEPHALTMTIADVSGKAMKAAMHAVFTSGLLLSRLHRDKPESVLREVAPTLFTRTDRQTFITCIIAQYVLKDKKLSIANAGHCLPILKRSGKAEFIRTPDPKFPLGLRQKVDYQAMEIQLQSNDFLLLYSDGLPEAVNPRGERFGFENMQDLVESLDTEHSSCNEVAMEIKRRVQKFSDYQLADDTTIICLKI